MLANVTETELIERCKRGERLAQKTLYEKYAGKMFGLCKRYVKTIENAEEVLMEGFCKVFQKIDMYSGLGSFEGWIRRVLTNEALMFIRKNYKFNEHSELDNIQIEAVEISIEEQLAASDILKLLDELPTGYRTVFNLYVMEGYKHREIAELLGISINTSKSQLILAKKRLKELIEAKQ
jgi:RNA polymerase sigma-70 factor (ECF subfamily)